MLQANGVRRIPGCHRRAQHREQLCFFVLVCVVQDLLFQHGQLDCDLVCIEIHRHYIGEHALDGQVFSE
jgi:hypothetical protein